ncbi:unnamed protein product [Symbiodinium pilosum]|uniref:Uncharacterized protein n=1 Tax=Symbiodinium pilosum TaxID=2952 RepID=A0A812SNI7_SYMPI|nr:unnamed protein product [Symbiodinium pilosum]
MLVLIRMTAEHGLAYAIRYERDLHYELQSLTRQSEKFSFSDLLHRPLRRITHKLDIKHYRARRVDDSEKLPNVPEPRKPRVDKGKTGIDMSGSVHMQDGAFGHYGARSVERYAAALKSFKARRAKKPTGLDKSNLLGLLAGQSPGRVPHFMSL